MAVAGKALLAGVGVALVVASAVLFFAWSGLYNVAASRPHWALTRWFLEFGLRRSVATHSASITPPTLDDKNLVILGAGHFDGGCAPCHGAPGGHSDPIVGRMLPAPPELGRAASDWSAEQLFWIVKHGLKFTGMPAWVAQRRDDEVWAVVAFLRALSRMSASQYRLFAIGVPEARPNDGAEIARNGMTTEALTRCVRCHRGDAQPRSALVPRLAGQSQAYVERALRDFAGGLRPSGIMEPIAAALDGAAIAALSAYYAGAPNPAPSAPPTESNADQIARGEEIATKGVAESGVPPCLVCHGDTRAPSFPKLDGQYAPYIVGQIEIWKRGLRKKSGYGAIMGTIASRLTDAQARDVAAYFASVAAGPPEKPAPPSPRRGRRAR
ncbi:c-type cytochrome [Methylocystis sp. SC2]|uniref:c-type cytochrome n=1 Tax=Methylocystis sp. (strain SC2) TaxID=187303 RepID=UPI00027AF4A8|nr:c-type cytochrome [Methylocystis sp. SC2]CCJ07244.1 Cytochrome c class I protein [Methylocystis sp. SC2]